MVAIVTGSGLGLERTSGFVLGSRGGLGDAGFGRYGESVTVNAATGNLLINRTDEILIGRGPDSVMSRSYNSLGGMTDDNGDNWQLGAQRRVGGLTGTLNTVGSTVTRYDWDGSNTVFTWDASVSAYVNKSGSGAYDHLSFASDIWTWQDGDSRVTETYDDLNGGRIIGMKDADDNALTYSYTGSLLTRVTTASGERTDLTWSGNNLTQVVTTLSGGATVSRVLYDYDSSNRLVTVTTDLSPEDGSVSDGHIVVTSYTYDGSSARVASISQTGGAQLAISYVLVGSDYRVAGLVQTLASGVTSQTSFAYDTVDRITTVTDGQGQVSKLSYDADGQLVQLESPPAAAGAPAQIVSYTYNANGDVISATDAGGKTVVYEYDARGNMTLMRDAAGNTVTRTYGAQNELLTETRYGVADPDGAGAGQPSQPVTTRFAYDAKGHLRFSVSAEGHVTEYISNAYGQLVTTIAYRDQAYDISGLGAGTGLTEIALSAWAAGIADKSGISRVDSSYDFRGNVATVTSWSGASAAGAGTGTATTVTYTYDQFGHLLTRQASGVANSEIFTYDGLGRLVGSTDLNGAATSMVFTDSQNKVVTTLANGLIQTSLYDLAGRLISQTESGTGFTAGTATYQYDNLGRLRMVSDATLRKSYFLYDHVGRKVADIGADGSIVEYGYDAANRLINTIAYATKLSAAQLGSLVDGSGQPANVLLSALRPASVAADQWSWHVYDAADRLIQTIDGTGATTVFLYDGLSNVVKTTSYANILSVAAVTGFKTAPPTSLQLPAANAAKDQISRNFYDRDGRLIGSLNGAGSLVTIRYNESGAKIQETAHANLTTASLRAAGTLAELLASVGSSAKDRQAYYAYDGRGLLRYALDGTLRPTEYVYDAAGRVTSQISHGASIGAGSDYSLSYIAGQISTLGLSSHADTRKSWSVYDAAGRVAYTVNAGGGVSSYSYDAQGRVIKETRFANVRATTSQPSLGDMASWVAANGHASDRTARTLYDQRGRVAYSVDPENFVTSYLYDDADRVTGQIRFAAAYSVNDSMTTADLAALIGSIPASAVQTSFVYDNVGRLQSSTDAMGVVTRTDYDALGRVMDVTIAYGTSEASVTRYTYDAAGRVASETRGFGSAEAATSSNSYDGLGQLLTQTDARGFTTSYIYDAAGNLLSVTRPIDAANTAVTSYSYDAFGQAITTTDARGNISYNFYDKLGRLSLQLDAERYATATSYTAMGEMASVTRYATKYSGTITAGTAPTITLNEAEDAVTSFAYDKLGRVTQVTDAMEAYEQYTLNSFGDRVSVRNKLGGIITNIYDKRGLLVSETLPMNSVASAGAVASSTVTNQFSYDARGNRIQMIEAAGLSEARTTSYAYDKLDRLVQTTGMAVAVASTNALHGAGSVAASESFAYDNRGNIIEHVAAGGARTLSYYDSRNRKIAEVNAAGTLSTWAYDANGNVTSIRVYAGTITLPAAAGGSQPAPVNAANYRETSFTYDRANRLLTTSVAALRTGGVSGANYATMTGAISSTNHYDKLGNVIRSVDASGNSVYYFYDKLGRKVGQADQELYFISFRLDADGNVVTEHRYATKLASAPTAGTLPTAPTASSDDRITNFTYDRNGRRLMERRQHVEVWAVNATTGALTALSTTQNITYTYNGLGNITRKTEATGDYIDYDYDLMGRQTSMTSSAFKDFNGTSVQRVTNNYYDGLNNLTRSVQNEARETRYSYNAAGQMTQMTDPGGTAHHYSYDSAGRMVREYRQRSNSAGVSLGWEASATRYDELGRVIGQGMSLWNGSLWAVPSEEVQIAYNEFGETIGRGINGTSQESYAYDAAGRVWRSTAEDGTVKLYLYDADGRQTLVISSSGAALPAGYSWSTITTDQAVALLTNSGAAAIGAVNVPGMVVTIAVYDRRGQLIETRAPLRETTAIGSNLSTISQKRTYNAFGEVTQETDARNYTTDFSYNTMGRLIQKQSPMVAWTAENGVIANARPTETYYYDRSGRMVGVRDANNNLNTRSLLSGTGYEGSEALVLKEFHADSGILTNGYDAFNDLRKLTNELGFAQLFTYDNLSQLIQHAHAQRSDGTQLINEFAYDSAGNRIKQWNSQYGAAIAATTDYDAQGRVTKSVDMGGDTTSYAYAWSSGITTTGLGTFGGWTKTTTNAAGKVMTEQNDYFGRQVDKVDYGANDYAFGFNEAGHLITKTNNRGENISYTYYNTGLMASIVSSYNMTGYSGSTATSTFKYDTQGNRTFEGHIVNGWQMDWYYGTTYTYAMTHQQATVTWDALNRMTSFVDPGTSSSPVNIIWEYDLSSNIRRMKSVFRYMNEQGVVATTDTTQDYWYKYDNMNRVVVNQGMLKVLDENGSLLSGVVGDGARGLSGATVTIKTAGPAVQHGYLLSYDLTGKRISSTYNALVGANGGWISITLSVPFTDYYHYSEDGYLNSVDATSGVVNQIATYVSTRGVYVRDAMGRVTEYSEYNSTGYVASNPATNRVYRQQSTYNAKSQLVSDITTSVRSDGTWVNSSTYFYNATETTAGSGEWIGVASGGTYIGGVVTRVVTSVTKNGSSQTGNTTTNSYRWWDGAVQVKTGYVSGSTSNTSTFHYNSSGHLASVYIQDGRPRTVSFINDAYGQILQRDEVDNKSTGDPRELHFYFNGMRVGDISNNGTSDVNYAASITRHIAIPGTGPFRSGATSSSNYADFGQSYDPINGLNYESTSSRYTVKSGDTLESIAYNLWGDASFWYMIAEANGLSMSAELVSGMNLTIPNKVHNSHNNVNTYKVYDPNEAIGETAPTAPKVNKNNKCGVFGQILIMAVAVAVSIVLPGASSFAGAALNAAITSTVSQGFGIIAGIQDKFSFKGVAMAAVTAGAGGVDVGGSFSGFGKLANVARGVANGVVRNVLTQGIGLATGLQSQFSWAGVASAGAMGGVSSSINLKGDVGQFAKNMAGGIVGAAATSLVTGRNFGDTLMSQLPSIIGNTVGSLVSSAIARTGVSSRGSQIEVTGKYNLSGLADYEADRVILPGSLEDSLSPTALNVPASGNNDALVSDIVVTAQKSSMYAVKYFSDAGQFDAVEAIALMQGYLHPNQQNAFYRQLVGNIAQNTSNLGRAPSIGPMATLGLIGRAVGEGVYDVALGVAGAVQLGAGLVTFEREAYGALYDIGRRTVNGEILQSAVGTLANIVDQLIVHDNPLPAIRAGTSGLISAGAGRILPIRAGSAGTIAAESRVLSPATNVADAGRLRSQLMSQEIAGGHAFEKHVLGVGNPSQAEFGGLGIRTRNQFADHIENVINNPTQSGSLRGGREFFYDGGTNTIVIRNPRAVDGGTAFRPVDPEAYLKNLR